MTFRGGEWARATIAAIVCLAPAGAAAATSHRVAAVDPDPQVARALDVALSPWDVTLVEVQLESPGATMPIALERARAIARDASAEVVVWVSSADDGFAVWIYDAASDHASARKLDESPPFDGPTAAGVALSVKTLLRATAVAPPPERFGAPTAELPWRIGLSVGAARRIDASSPLEPRFGVQASGWSPRWGALLDVESGPGWHPANAALTGTVTDTSFRLAVGVHLPLSGAIAIEPSVGAALHLVRLDAEVVPGASHVTVDRVDVAADPRVVLDLSLLGGRLHVAPWAGVAVLSRWQRFEVHDVVVLELAPVLFEAGLGAAVALP